MRPRSALGTVFALLLGACNSQIVLGDAAISEPTAGAPTAGQAPEPPASQPHGGAAGASGTAEVPAQPGPLPAEGELVWSTDFEVGDFTDWDRGGAYYGGEYEWGDVNGYVDIGVGLDGSNGVVADINTDSRDEASQGVRMYRRIDAQAAYYSAWFRLEEAHTVSDWWSIFLFHSRDDSLSLDNDLSMWDVRVVDTPAGDMALQFFDHDTMHGTLAGDAGRVVEGQWFQIRAFLEYRPPADSRLAVWLGDALLFDQQGLHTAAQTNVFWSIGNGAAGLTPGDSTLYLDDAAIHRAGTP